MTTLIKTLAAVAAGTNPPTITPTNEDLLMSIKGNVLPQYLSSGDPALKDYYPAG